MSIDFITGCMVGGIVVAVPLLAWMGSIRIIGRNYTTKRFIEILDRDIEATTKFRDALMAPSIDAADHLSNVGTLDKEMDMARQTSRRQVFTKAKSDGLFAGVRKATDRMIEAYRRRIREMS